MGCVSSRVKGIQKVSDLSFDRDIIAEHLDELQASTKEQKVRELSQRRLYDFIYDNLIGKDATFKSPYGQKTVVYCDYTASGRPLRYMEQFIIDQVYELYANTHTTANVTGRTTQYLREEARQIIKKCVNASEDDVVIFTGNGVTGAVHKLIGVLNLRESNKKTVVFVGPYEHHSNILPWKEVGAKVVRISENKHGGQINTSNLVLQLKQHCNDDFNIIASFSAASNITGIITNTNEITRVVHQYGGNVFWDYATAGPYLDIDVNPSISTSKDAVFLSPHKFVGGPGTPGILIAKRKLFQNKVPHCCGGGTVVYVTREAHRYVEDIEAREEGGTPAIVEAIRAGLVFQLKMNVDSLILKQREHELCNRAFKVWKRNKNLVVLGSHTAKRIPIFSLLIRHPVSNTLLHYNFVAAVLNDLFGIQSRGGCACAGPYAEDLLGISESLASKFFFFLTPLEERHRDSLSSTPTIEPPMTMSLMKPGFTRLNLPYFVDDDVIDYIIEAVNIVATHGWLLLPQYTFDSYSGAWFHKEASSRQELSLTNMATDIKTRHVQSRKKSRGAITHVKMMKAAKQVLRNARDDAKLYTHDNEDIFQLVPQRYHDLVWFTTPNDARKAMSESISVFNAGSRQPFKPRPSTIASRISRLSTSLKPSTDSVFSELLKRHN